MRAGPVGFRDGDREQLERWVRCSTIPAGFTQRARIVQLAADGRIQRGDLRAARGVSKLTVTSWRDRYRECGIAALDDRPGSGRTRTLDHREIVAATLMSPPAKLGVTHWSSRLLARHLEIGTPPMSHTTRLVGSRAHHHGPGFLGHQGGGSSV
jgi:DNA-binding transcriptional ArsR family regulator